MIWQNESAVFSAICRLVGGFYDNPANKPHFGVLMQALINAGAEISSPGGSPPRYAAYILGERKLGIQMVRKSLDAIARHPEVDAAMQPIYKFYDANFKGPLPSKAFQ